MKVIIAGSRDLTAMALVVQAIEKSGFKITEVVCGEAKGPDTLGRIWAEGNNIPVASFPAAWRVDGRYNPRAGFDRNEKMGDYAEAAICVWDGKSGGTKHMINYMKKLGKPCYVHRHDFVDLFSGDYWWGDSV